MQMAKRCSIVDNSLIQNASLLTSCLITFSPLGGMCGLSDVYLSNDYPGSGSEQRWTIYFLIDLLTELQKETDLFETGLLTPPIIALVVVSEPSLVIMMHIMKVVYLPQWR